MKRFVLAATAALSALCATAPAHAMVVGNAEPGTGSSIPFDTYLGGYYYAQVYNKAVFGAGLDISRISFYNTQYPGGTPATGNFVFWLGTSTGPLATFDTDGFFPYPDASFTQVFNGTIPAIADGRIDFDLSSAFHYDASAGNLLLIVRNTDLSGDGNLFLDIDNNAADMNSRFSAYTYPSDAGLVTGFNEGLSAGAVPEPATWAMMIAGFGLVGATMRRRKATVRFA